MPVGNRTNLRLAVEVEGVRPIFVEEVLGPGFPFPPDEASDPRTQFVGIVPGSVSLGEARLNLDTRQEEGSSLSVRLRDDSARTLRDLFAARRRAPTFLTADIAKADVFGGLGSISVDSTTGFPFSGDVVIGAERFFYNSTTATSFDDAYRGMFGTPEQNHFGGTNSGEAAGIFPEPSSWRGKRVTLHSAVLDAAGAVTLTTIATFRLDGPPQFAGGDVWELNASALANWYRERPIYIGQKPTKPEQGEAEFRNRSVFKVPEKSAQLFKAPSGGNTHLLVKSGDLFGLLLLGAVDVPNAEVDWLPFGFLTPSLFESVEEDRQLASAVVGVDLPQTYDQLQQVQLLAGSPPIVTLNLLLSVLGDGANGTYDRLPGVERAAFDGEQWRFGAGIKEADVDADAFLALDGPTWTMLLKESFTVGELMREFCQTTQSFWYVDATGRITVERLRDRIPVSIAAQNVTITDSNLSPQSEEALSADEAGIIHTVTLKTQFDWLRGGFLAEVNVIDADLFNRFPESAQRRVYESKTMSVDAPVIYPTGAQRLRRSGPVTIDEAEAALRQEQVNNARPTAEFNVRATWDAAAIRPGQAVLVTNPRVPDLEGATLSGQVFRVLGRRLDFDDGTVQLRLRLADRGFLFAPSAIVSAWDGGLFELTLQSAPVLPFSNASPGDHFAEGQSLYLYDVSTDTEFTGAIATIAGNVLTLTGGPGFTPVAGDIVTFAYSGLVAANGDGFTEDEYLMQVGEDGEHNGNEGTRMS